LLLSEGGVIDRHFRYNEDIIIISSRIHSFLLSFINIEFHVTSTTIPPTMSQTMKALVVQPDYSVKLQDKPKPSASDLGPKEVIFKILAVGQSELLACAHCSCLHMIRL
jgi:hypothetical protein